MRKQEKICELLKCKVRKSGMTQKEIAEKAGMTPQALNDMLNGRKIIRAEHIPIITEALGISPNDLYGIGVEKDAS